MKAFTTSIGDIRVGHVGDGLKNVIEGFRASTLFTIADENTIRFCVPALEGIIDTDRIIMTRSGEANKNLESCNSIWNALIDGGADKDSVVINVGGGLICDMGGFAAACFQRGIRFGHLPTTVLAMTDAAIGGKLGVDFKGYKNYIGLIRPPSFVWIDQSFLDTLPLIEMKSGLAEIVKHAIIGSRSLWELLSRVDKIDNMPWDEVFNMGIPVKVNIVEKDINEQGLRKVLNFGHTIGHGIESYYLAKGQPVMHGQCVALGMMAESKISSSLGLLSTPDFEAIIDVIMRMLNIAPLPDVEDVIPWLMKDKKRSGGRVGFSLPDGIGSCRWDIPVDIEIVRESFGWLHAQVNSVPFRLSVEK